MVEFENVELVEGSRRKCPHCGCFDYVEVIVKNMQLKKHSPANDYIKRCVICGEIMAIGSMANLEEMEEKWRQDKRKEIEQLENWEIKSKEREQQEKTRRIQSEYQRIQSEYGGD